MKRIVVTGLLFTFLMHLTSFCSEKRCLHTLTRHMRNRHTYEKDSFAHKRDAAILYLLPAPTAQKILAQQRSNMQHFLEQNEENALEEVKKDFDFNDEEWSTIMNTIDKESQFNLKAMQQKDTRNKGIHDQSLPNDWVDALHHECERHKILPENLTFKKIKGSKSYANAVSIRPLLEKDIYFPAEIGFNFSYSRPHRRQMAAHEVVHAIKNHGLVRTIILHKRFLKSNPLTILKNNSPQLLTGNPLDYIGKSIDLEYETIMNYPAYKKFRAAQEKTADTLIACTDPEYTQDYADLVRNKTLSGVYPENHNDVMVLADNWKLSKQIEKRTQWHNASSTKKCQKQFPLKFSGPST